MSPDGSVLVETDCDGHPTRESLRDLRDWFMRLGMTGIAVSCEMALRGDEASAQMLLEAFHFVRQMTAAGKN